MSSITEVRAVFEWLSAVPVSFHPAPGAPRLPAGLIRTVPGQALRGRRMTGYQKLIGNLYGLAGLVGLPAVAAWMLARVPGRAWRLQSARPERLPCSAAAQ